MSRLVMVLLLTWVAPAQAEPPVITADNIRHLHSVAHLDFAALPEAAGQVDSGWFAMSADGEAYAVVNRQNQVIFWTLETGLLQVSDTVCPQADGSSLPGAFVDGAFGADSRVFAAAYLAGGTSYIRYEQLDTAQGGTVLCDIPAAPLRVWFADQRQIWLELLPNDFTVPPSVQAFSVLTEDFTDEPSLSVSLPSGPENDSESFARIGRIEPPLAVTVTRAGLLKRWQLETGAVTATAQLDALPGIGQLNYGGEDEGRFFAWVDNQSEALYLLDFTTGENRQIVRLSGTSVPFLWLTSGADVAIGVNVGVQTSVTAWMLAAGVHLDLGSYRPCRRLPDMVRLSRDGTTLVIGCDTGLDVWRIETEKGGS